MKRSNPFIEKDDQKIIWVCASCRKSHNGLILVGKWKLIDRSLSSEFPCSACGAERSASHKYLTSH